MIKTFEDYVKSNKTNKGFVPATPVQSVTSDVKREVTDPIIPDSSISDLVKDSEKSKKDMHNGKEVSGFKEVIEIVGLGKMKAKLDTGNTAYCAIIIQSCEEKDGKVSFDFDGEKVTYDIVKHIKIWHHGKSTERPVIKVDIKFNGKLYKDELVDLKISDLSGTKSYRSRLLISKGFMEKANIVIDPSKEFKLTDKKELKKKK